MVAVLIKCPLYMMVCLTLCFNSSIRTQPCLPESYSHPSPSCNEASLTRLPDPLRGLGVWDTQPHRLGNQLDSTFNPGSISPWTPRLSKSLYIYRFLSISIDLDIEMFPNQSRRASVLSALFVSAVRVLPIGLRVCVCVALCEYVYV